MAFTQEQIAQLEAQVLEQRKELEKLREAMNLPWKTSGQTILNGKERSIAIMTPDECISWCAYILSIYKTHEEAQNLLNTKGVLNINGFTFESWLNDLRKQVAIKTFKSESDRLTALERRIENNLYDDDMRKQKEFNEILNSLKK